MADPMRTDIERPGPGQPSRIEPFGNAVIVTILGPLEVSFIDRIEAAGRALGATKRRPIGMVIDVAKMMPPPDDLIRDRITLCMRQFERSVGALAVLIRQPGLGGVAWRTMHSTLFLITRTKYDKKVFADAHEGARWIAERVPGNDAPRLGAEILRRAE